MFMSTLTTFEYNLFLGLTIIILATKLALSIYLAKKIYNRKKETGEFSFGFIFTVFILMICLFISRLFYLQFDFVYTKFDVNLFHTTPAVLYWKVGALTSMIGFALFFFTVDKKILDFKFKGLFTYLILVFALIAFFYPVKNSRDFEIMSLLLTVSNVVAIIIPILFFYIGKKSDTYRTPAFLIAIGIILYAFGSNLNVETLIIILTDSFGSGTRIFMYFLSLIFKVSGLILFSYAVTDFVNKFS